MANQGEPMDLDDISEFDNKENSLQHSNVLSHQTDKGYEELDVSELNMKLRWSTSTQFSPSPSPMSKSSTATCFDNKSLDYDGLNNTVINESSNQSQSLNSSTPKSDTLVKTPKLLPLQVLPSDDANRNACSHIPFDGTVTLDKNDITVTVTETSDNDDNYSLASSSTSPDYTPEATTPIKEIPKPTGSPIMRGIKSVLNMFRPSQSPIPTEENEVKSPGPEILRPIEGISPLTIENPLDSRPQSVLASTPIVNHRNDNFSKRNSPLKQSIVFNEDLAKELEWKDDSTIIFSNKERTPFHKLFFHQLSTSPENSSLTEGTLDLRPQISKVEQNVITSVESHVSDNNSIFKDTTISQIQASQVINEKEEKFSENILEKDESVFLDCEMTMNESQLFQLLDDVQNQNMSSQVNNAEALDITPPEKQTQNILPEVTNAEATDITSTEKPNQNMSPEVNNSDACDITPPEKNTEFQNDDTTESKDLATKTAEIIRDIKIECEELVVDSVISNIASLNSCEIIDKLPSLLENVEALKPNTTSVTASNVAANIDRNIINTEALNNSFTIIQSKCLSDVPEIGQPTSDQSLEMASNTALLLNQTIDVLKCAEIPLPEDEFTDIGTDVTHDPKLDIKVEYKINDVPAKKFLDDSKLIETVPASDIEHVNSDAIETTDISLAHNITLPIEEVLSIKISEINISCEPDILNKCTIPKNYFINPDIFGNTSHVITKESKENKEIVHITPKITKVSDTKQELMESVQESGNDTTTGKDVFLPITPDIQPKSEENTISQDRNVTFTEFRTFEEIMQLTESETENQVAELKESSFNIHESFEPEHLRKVNSSDANSIPHVVDIVTQPTPNNFDTPVIFVNVSEPMSKKIEDKKDVGNPISEISNVTEVKQEAVEMVQGNSTKNKIVHISLPGTPDHKLEKIAISHTTLIGLPTTTDNLQFMAESQTTEQIGQLDGSSPEIVTEVGSTESIEEGNKSFGVGLGPHTDFGFQLTTTNFISTEIICNVPKVITKDSCEDKKVVNISEISMASKVDGYSFASVQDNTNNTTINKEEYVADLKFEETATFKDGNVTSTYLQPTKQTSQFSSESQTADNSYQLIKSHNMNIEDSVELKRDQEVDKYSDVIPHEDVTPPINYFVEEPMDISMVELDERDIVQVNVVRIDNANVSDSSALADILSTKNNETPKDIQIVKDEGGLHLIENVEDEPMDISVCEIKEQGTKTIEEKIIENKGTVIVIETTESNKQECLKETSTEILIQKTEQDTEIEALEEELIFSEDNSPYVSLSAPEELSEKDKAEDVVSIKTNMTMSASPPISSKGYNINFDEIENPFVSKSKVSLSSNLNQTFEPIDKVPTNSSFGIEQSPIKPEPNKTITLDVSSTPIDGLPKETHLDVTEYIKEDQDSINLYKTMDLGEIKMNYLQSEKRSPGDSTHNTAKAVYADIIVNKTSQEIKCDIPETYYTQIELTTNITSQAIEGEDVVLDNFATSSSEQSAYYSIGTFSGEEAESKPTSSLSDVDEMNVNHVRKIPLPESGDMLTNKSNIPLSSPPDTETENPFKTISKIRQSPPPNFENHNPFKTITKIAVSPNTSSILAKPDVLIAENPESQSPSENKSTTEGLHVETEELNINSTTFLENSKASCEKESTVIDAHTEDEETMEGPFIEADLEDDNGKLSAIESEKAEINQFTDFPPQETDENFEAAGELFIDADAFEFLMNQNKSGEVTDSGKESLFLKFDPLFARRVNSDGIADVLSKLQKRQSTPKKMKPLLTQDLMSLEKSPIAGPSNVASVQNTTTESSCEDLNITVAQKPTMLVPPAVNPVVTPRKKATTPVRSCNRLSMNFTSPAMAVIDRLLSLSANNSPASPERAPPINMEQREADSALIQLRELLAEKELNVHHLRCESKELRDRFTVLDSQIKNLEAVGEKRLKNIKELNEKLSEKNQENKNMSAVVEEYERTIAGLIAGIEEDKKKHAEERLQLITERDEQTAHLASMEVAFSDLHSKYEKSKQVIMSYKAREDTFRKSNKEFEDNLVKMQNNYELLKQHATSKLNHANQELEKMNRSHESEVLKLNAMIKRKDLHISSLEETLAQKTKANEELTAICDDLINRVG